LLRDGFPGELVLQSATSKPLYILRIQHVHLYFSVEKLSLPSANGRRRGLKQPAEAPKAGLGHSKVIARLRSNLSAANIVFPLYVLVNHTVGRSRLWVIDCVGTVGRAGPDATSYKFDGILRNTKDVVRLQATATRFTVHFRKLMESKRERFGKS
jgi:hypothetical protein